MPLLLCLFEGILGGWEWDAAPYLVLTFCWTVLDVEAVVDIIEDTGICLAQLASIHAWCLRCVHDTRLVSCTRLN